MIVLFLMTGCQKEEEVIDGPSQNIEEGYMGEVSFDGKQFSLHLDLSDGTGYEWLIVAHSDNLEIEDKGFYVDRSDDPTSTGGSGVKTFEGRLNGSEDGWLILKCACPWEGDGDYHIYLIRNEDEKIAEIETRITRLHADTDFIYSRGDEVSLCMFLRKGWEHEAYLAEGRPCLLLKTDDKREIRIEYDPDAQRSSDGKEGEKMMICDQEFSFRIDEKTGHYEILGKDIVCFGDDLRWYRDNYFEMIRILDSIFTEY